MYFFITVYRKNEVFFLNESLIPGVSIENAFYCLKSKSLNVSTDFYNFQVFHKKCGGKKLCSKTFRVNDDSPAVNALLKELLVVDFYNCKGSYLETHNSLLFSYLLIQTVNSQINNTWSVTRIIPLFKTTSNVRHILIDALICDLIACSGSVLVNKSILLKLGCKRVVHGQDPQCLNSSNSYELDKTQPRRLQFARSMGYISTLVMVVESLISTSWVLCI
jgi:hypothetical protein